MATGVIPFWVILTVTCNLVLVWVSGLPSSEIRSNWTSMKSEWNQQSPTTMIPEDCESSRVQCGKVHMPVHRICLHIQWIEVDSTGKATNATVSEPSCDWIVLESKLMILLKAAGDDVWSLWELADRGSWTCHVMSLSFESVLPISGKSDMTQY